VQLILKIALVGFCVIVNLEVNFCVFVFILGVR
jgi:hypothetical protein